MTKDAYITATAGIRPRRDTSSTELDVPMGKLRTANNRHKRALAAQVAAQVAARAVPPATIKAKKPAAQA
jgi:hypothetical protein